MTVRTTGRRCAAALAGAVGLLLSAGAAAYEADVHYALTRWLAMRADFTESEAERIAIGNANVDAGMMDAMVRFLDYACLARSGDAAELARDAHFPSPAAATAPASAREVVPGSAAARNKLVRLKSAASTQPGVLLHKFGEALHLLQDSWSHQGVAAAPSKRLLGIGCDASLSWGPAGAVDGPSAHRAGIARLRPAELLSMAAATYDELLAYPRIDGRARSPASWENLRSEVGAFARLQTKAEMRRWFVERGVDDAGRLNVLSVPDGARAANDGPPPLPPLLPVLHKAGARQAGVDAALLGFFERFFHVWLSAADPAAVLGADADAPPNAELAGRLRALRLKDHGLAAPFVHASAPLPLARRQGLARLVAQPGRLATYASPFEAFVPVMAQGPVPTPSLPYLVHTVRPDSAGRERAAAVAKLRHAPYDEVAFVVHKSGGAWRLADVVAVAGP